MSGVRGKGALTLLFAPFKLICPSGRRCGVMRRRRPRWWWASAASSPARWRRGLAARGGRS
jgi:hypothetical protein